MDAARLAAVATWLMAAGFGLPAVPVAVHLLRKHELPEVFGAFRAYGGGLFERCSPAVFVVLLGAFLVLNVVEAYGGVLLWHHEHAGGVLVLALLPLEILFWAGFALPIPPIIVAARLVLLLLAWEQLR